MATAPMPVELSAKTSDAEKTMNNNTAHCKINFFIALPAQNWVYYNLRIIEDAMVNRMNKSITPFAKIQEACKKRILDRRRDINTLKPLADKIIEANCPYELRPANPSNHGVLLIHGLLDCPFSLREIGQHLCEQGLLVRSVLLPGHGTRPEDLMHVTYHDWIATVQNAIADLKQETSQVSLIGYSTGAALSVYEGLHDNTLTNLVLLSPAIKVKVPVNLVVTWHYITSLFSKQKGWICQTEELDYAKYLSVPFNAVNQVNALTEVIRKRQEKHPLPCPMYMIMSREDETISSQEAIKFFESQHHPESRLLLYTGTEQHYPDTRITTRLAHYPNQHIKHLSHTSVPFSIRNSHYGQHGDYVAASHPHHEESVYGAYNRIEVDFFGFLYHLGLTQHKRRELTYNPDFDHMVNSISDFILNATNKSSS